MTLSRELFDVVFALLPGITLLAGVAIFLWPKKVDRSKPKE